jgi:transcriptional regulator with XRE-family HTH domain
MKRTVRHELLPAAVAQVLERLGAQIATARKRRHWTQDDLARRIGVSKPTVVGLEGGKPGTALGVYVAALWALGLHHALAEFAQPAADQAGLVHDLARLGERVRRPHTLDDDF